MFTKTRSLKKIDFLYQTGEFTFYIVVFFLPPYLGPMLIILRSLRGGFGCCIQVRQLRSKMASIVV